MEKISDTIRKRGALFFGHPFIIKPGGLTNQILRLFEIRKTTVRGNQEGKKNIKEMGIRDQLQDLHINDHDHEELSRDSWISNLNTVDIREKKVTM